MMHENIIGCYCIARLIIWMFYACNAGCSRQYTVSIAVPGSILDNAQSAELRTYVVGQVLYSQSVVCTSAVRYFNLFAE